jgi:micrococcal nuclease
MYHYKAHLVRVIDGDTIELRVDVGFHTYVQKKFRVLGVDTPELRGGTEETKAKAKEAKNFVMQVLNPAHHIWVRTMKPDSFGRWLADVTYMNVMDGVERNLAQELIENGHGEPYSK